jgi:pimeloyl-ACP methyl ester carboxylesterase
VGHSMGGMVAQWLALTFPQRIYSYTSLSVATCGIIGRPPKRVMDVLLDNKPTQNVEKDLAGFMRSWKVLNGDYEVDREIATKYTKDLYSRSKHPVGVAWHHIWCQKNYIDLSDKLGLMSIPGLFIHGELDPLIPLEAAIETQKFTPHSTLRIIPGMGHMIFNRELEASIASLLIDHFVDAM